MKAPKSRPSRWPTTSPKSASRPAARAGEPCQLEIVNPFTGLQLDNQTITTASGTGHIEARRFRGENVVHVFGTLPAGNEPELVEMTVLRPAEWFITALNEALRQNEIIVDGAARAVTWPSPAPSARQKISQFSSPPLRELVHDFMKTPQSLEADLILNIPAKPCVPTTCPHGKLPGIARLMPSKDFSRRMDCPQTMCILTKARDFRATISPPPTPHLNF
ncbi:MAG: D-alanyl-D-alanine carboxypeptidase [Limisphaerales bacterium]